MGLPVFWHSHTTAERVSLSFHSQRVTSQGCTMRVSLAAAARSVTTVASACVCKKVAGMSSEILPSTIFCMMSAFSSPHAVTNIFLAFSMLLIPSVTEHGGTGSCDTKLMFISLRVMSSVNTSRATLVSPLPGSLLATFPRRPMPSTKMSMPPCALICFS